MPGPQAGAGLASNASSSSRACWHSMKHATHPTAAAPSPPPKQNSPKLSAS